MWEENCINFNHRNSRYNLTTTFTHQTGFGVPFTHMSHCVNLRDDHVTPYQIRCFSLISTAKIDVGKNQCYMSFLYPHPDIYMVL